MMLFFILPLLLLNGMALRPPVKIEPLWLRSQAVLAPLPTVSCETIRGNHLRIVIEVVIGPRGDVVELHTLDGTGDPLSTLAQTAVRDWRFQDIRDIFPQEKEELDRVGRIILYVKPSNAGCLVIDAAAQRLDQERRRK